MSQPMAANKHWVRAHALRGRTATQRSKKGSEKVLGRGSGEGFSEGFREVVFLWFFTVKRGSEKGVSRRCLERPLAEYDPPGACALGQRLPKGT